MHDAFVSKDNYCSVPGTRTPHPPLDSISTHEEFFLLLEIVIRLLKDKAPLKIQIGEIVDENMVD